MFTGNRIRLILNPGSGTGSGARLSGRIVRFVNRYGPAELDVQVTGDRTQATDLARSAADDGFRLILAAGGDGTVTGVAHGVLQSGQQIPIGIIPLGTGNGLARVLGLPRDPLNAVHTLAEGKVVQVDTVDVPSHGAISLLFMGAGLDAEINRDANGEQKSRLGFLAYVHAGFQNAAGRQNHMVRMVVDGQEREVEAHTVSLFNATRLPFIGTSIGPDAHPHDGVAQLSVMSSPGLLPLVGQLVRIFSGPVGAPELEAVSRLEVSAEPPLLVHIDGDVVGQTPFTARVLPGALPFVAAASYRIRPTHNGSQRA